MTQARLTVIPLTVAAANRVVGKIHRHHAPCPPALVYFACGVAAEGRLCGAALVGRPSNRNSDDGQTGEVLRVATDGTPNAPSALYGACAAAARRIGFARLITYTLDSEPGTSLRAAGWVLEESGIESWWGRYPDKNAAANRTVRPLAHLQEGKQRWSVRFRDPVEVDAELGREVAASPDQSELGLVPA